MHKRFQLVRKSDAVGISGSCVICEGILWSDGSATTKYRRPLSSETSWADGVSSLEQTLLHAKLGVTEIVWLDGDDASSC